MFGKRLLVAVLAMIIGGPACGRNSASVTAPSASPSPPPTASVERLDYYLEGNERPFRFELFYTNHEFPCTAPGPCKIAATYREQTPHKGSFDGTAFVFDLGGSSDTVTLAIPADYAERIRLFPGNTYQIIAQTVMSWPDGFGLMIKQGEELVFQGISDWRFDASIHLGCLAPVRVEQVAVLARRYREGDACLGRFTNTEMQFSLGGDVKALHQGQSATISDYEISLEVARTLDQSFCPDAGAINVSYTISKRSPARAGAAKGAVESTTPGIVAAQQLTVPDANLEGYLRRLTDKDTGPLLGSDLEKLRCFVRLYPVDWSWESAPDQGRVASLEGLELATNLEAIYLDVSGVSDLAPLANLFHLTTLRIDHNEVSDLSPLMGLTSLNQLWAGNNHVSDLVPLSGLNGLSHLNLDDNGITELSPLSSLTNLAELSLYQNQITDISPLSSLANLERLRLDSNQIEDVSPLSSLTNLVDLSLDQNEVTDVSPLGPLVNLVELSLSRNSVTDISDLAPLANLVVLYLGDNQIREIGALEHLTNLRLLDLQGNSISDISALLNNQGLGEGDYVDLRGNPLGANAVNTGVQVLKSRGVIVQ